MNKKLERLEFKETKKIMFFITALIAVYMLISVCCSSASNFSTNDASFIAKTILQFISALLVICSALIMVKRFYNVLFTNEGYSKLSFPVVHSAHLHTNFKYAFVWLSLQTFIFMAFLALSDLVQKRVVDTWGILNLYPYYLESYQMNVLGEYLAYPEIKALITVLLLIIACIIIAANIYLSFIFALTVSSFVCSKYNIVQKNGVIFLTGVFMYCFHLLASQLFNKLFSYINNTCFDSSAYGLFGPDINFIDDIAGPVICILFYGITAIIMYQISKYILNKKLDI